MLHSRNVNIFLRVIGSPMCSVRTWDWIEWYLGQLNDRTTEQKRGKECIKILTDLLISAVNKELSKKITSSYKSDNSVFNSVCLNIVKFETTLLLMREIVAGLFVKLVVHQFPAEAPVQNLLLPQT